uniref:ZP domain-containing protein n=1 Tax=Ascaris lumbricoides TaxID=6252 RepID=A0A0M3I199_ASCLU
MRRMSQIREGGSAVLFAVRQKFDSSYIQPNNKIFVEQHETLSNDGHRAHREGYFLRICDHYVNNDVLSAGLSPLVLSASPNGSVKSQTFLSKCLVRRDGHFNPQKDSHSGIPVTEISHEHTDTFYSSNFQSIFNLKVTQE